LLDSLLQETAINPEMAKTEDNRGFFDLKKQFTFYASYHNHPVNVAIHLVCIWQILWSFIALLQYTPAIVSTPSFVTSLSPILTHVSINGAFFFSLIYIVCYPIMDPAAGSLGALLVVALYVATGILVQTTTTIAGFSLLKVLGLFNASMWIAQFLGHGIFEGRAPALLDSWDQALITAPLFVLLEVLFFFGYRQEFYKDCMLQVEKNVTEFKKSKSK